MVLQDAEGDVAEIGGLAGAGRGDDEAAGALADGTEQIHDAGGHAAVLQLELDLLLGCDGREVGEFGALAACINLEAVDLLDEADLRVGKALVGRGHGRDHAALVEVKAADELARHERVGRPAFAVLREIEQRAVAAVVDVEDAFDADAVVRLDRRGSG
jgi:hypothetical protein